MVAPMWRETIKWPGHFQGIPLTSPEKSMTPVSEILGFSSYVTVKFDVSGIPTG
jgi:hypothetical protein